VKTINGDNDRLKSRVQFVERFASALTESGFPRMPARVFAALMASDSGALTAAELASLLRVSPAAISGAVRYLIQVNLASREPEPGSRRERYRVHNEVWYEAVAGKDRRLERCERSLRHGLDVVGRDSPAGQRIAETIAFFEFLQTELPLLMKEWQRRRARIRFAVRARGARNVGALSPRASERGVRTGPRRSTRERIG
jgi:DNA-binding transcriptional regulator GbsR (MarR family)